MTVLESFADWTSAQSNTWSDIAIERACHAIADTVGSMIAGGRETVVQEIVAGLYRASEGRAKNVGNDQTSEPSIAACINASAAHLLELDDNYYPALTHASAVSVPALLALAQEYEANGSAVIDGYIIGLELQAAIARGVNRSHYLAGWHGTGTIACIGTAGACARILGLNRAGIVNAMSIATSMAAGNKAQFGTTTKTLQCGLASRNAIAAAELARAGIEGDPAALESKHGFLGLYGGPSPAGYEGVAETLGDPLSIEAYGLAPKRHACCGSAHKSLDCIEDLRTKHNFAIEDIEKIEAWIGRTNRDNLRYDNPLDGYQAKFSLPYCVAALLKTGRVWLTEFEEATVHDPAIRQYLPLTRANVLELEEHKISSDAPIAHRVEITLRNGEILDQQREQAKGTIFDPFSEQERAAKFRYCCEAFLPPEQINSLWGSLMSLPNLGSVAGLIPDLHGASQ